MKHFHAVFSIVECRNCPLYNVGEKLILSDKTILCSGCKEICLILARDMTQLLFQLLGEKDMANAEEDTNFNCSGCKGLIKFTRLPIENQDNIEQSSDAASIDPVRKNRYDGIIDSPFFRLLSVEQVDMILANFREISLDEGTALIRKGEQNLNVYLVYKGKLRVEDDGIFSETLVEGELCGEMSYFGAEVAMSTVRAVKNTKVLAIAGDVFASLLGNNTLVEAFVVEILAKRLRKANGARARYFESCMSGRLDEIVPAELFQIFHMHKKTGVLAMELEEGTGKVSFREGCLINASYAGEKNQGAIFKMLAENKGVYRFTTGLSPEEMKAAEIGDFMMLLMEGVKRVDEDPDV